MNKTLFILLASFLLFYCYASKKTTPLLRRQIPDFLSGGDPTLRSYVLGDKRKLNRSLKWAHKQLSLLHLFTPSGLHLSSIFLLIWPILRMFSPRIRRVLSLILFILPFFLPGFWAIKRICLLRILKLFFSKLSWFSVFIIGFILDFFWGTFDNSPLSFCFSFLFLGLIFSLEDKRRLPLVLLCGQVLIAYFWQNQVNPFAVFLGQILTAIFSFLFPVFVMDLLIPLKILSYPLELFKILVLFSAKLVKNLPTFYVSFDILILFFLLISKLGLKKKIYLMLCFISFYPPNLFNLPPKYLRGKRKHDFYEVEERINIAKIKRTRRGYKVEYLNGYSCNYTLYNTFWRKKCN